MSTKSQTRLLQAPVITMTATPRFFSAGMLLLFLTLLVLITSMPYASAHPFIEETIPSAVQNGPIGTERVTVFFSEAVDIEYSEIRVIDDNGDRIDNRDLRYHQEGEETSLSISTPPLQDGVYTVSTKVLSKVDGHLVPGVFLFGIGNAAVDPDLLAQESSTGLLLLPEAGAELPGMIGQTIIVGAVVGALAVWGGVAKNRHLASKDDLDALESAHYKRFMQLTGAGLLLVLASDMLVIILQMIRLESGLVETIQTQFGLNWLARMIVIMVLVAVWFAANRSKDAPSRLRAIHWAMLATALALMMTSSLSGHGAATEASEAVMLDYIHNVVAGIWIGGIIYVVFGLLPALSRSPETYREILSLSIIPKFSMIFIISIGIVIVTGPTLLWMLESNVGLITESLFGKLIMLKVAIASVMVGMGAIVQYKIQKRAESDMRSSKRTSVYKQLKKTLKVDVGLGILLLVIVALLTNGTLPAGEIRNTIAAQETPDKGFRAIEFSDNAVFDIVITPFNTGDNLITVSVYNTDESSLEDLDKVKVKTSNPNMGIPPIEIEMSESLAKTHNTATNSKESPITYQGKMTLAFSGQWLIEVEAQRTQNANEAIRLDVFAKPDLANLDVTVTEYMLLPNGTSPLHVAYDHSGGMWFTDAAEPRLWKVDTDTDVITPYLFNGTASSFATYNEYDGNIWFTDSRGGQIGYVNIQNGNITTIQTPDFKSQAPTANPTNNEKAMPFFIKAGDDGDIWMTIINKGLIARYQVQSNEFAVIPVQGQDTFPFALASGPDGMMWYTATGTGAVGYVNPANNKLTQVIGPEVGLVAPEALLFEDKTSKGLWITEHTGLAVTRYDLVLETIERYTVPDPDALPFGMAFDRYGNIWFAQHTIDSIGALDPHTGKIIQIDIPTKTSFIQFVESDDKGNIWFAEQRADKIGKISISERPSTYRIQDQIDDKARNLVDVKYADFVSPLMALGVLATSLFYIKAVNDKRRLDRLRLLLDPTKQSS